ncbi:MAG TPA: hypothetical protein VGL56_16595 [Fimbriimonadaceae bacterium]
MAFVLTHPPVTLIFKVWNAVPGSVTDSDGRLGRVYQAPHGTRAIVVFNKGEGPRPNGPLDLVFPHPETKTVFMQCTVNPRTLFAGDYKSDEIFRDFLLSRIDGDGWASDAGGIATVKPEGHPNTYVLTNYERRQVPDGYTVKFHVGS